MQRHNNSPKVPKTNRDREGMEERNRKEFDDDYYQHQVIDVDPKQSSIRIDKFLMDRIENISRNRVQNAIRASAVLVDGKVVKPNFKIKPLQKITIVLPRPRGEGIRVIPQNIPLNIVYEDDDLMVVNKPAGMPVHPGVGNYRGTLVNALAYHFRNLPVMDGNDEDRLGLVHRIDKNTTGLLVVAKTEYAMAHLSRQFYYHTTDRTYQALVWGEPKEDEGTINAHVGRHPRFRKLFTTFPEGDQGKWAVTHYKVLERMSYVSLVQCNLETGRTHQIRVHMQMIGHPLFSDEKYGGDSIRRGAIFSKYKLFVEKCFSLLPRHALHAKSLGFEHPVTGERMLFESELPEDFQNALDAWRGYVEERKALLKEKK